MLTELEQKVADFIAAERLMAPGDSSRRRPELLGTTRGQNAEPEPDRVLLAVSGGADSTTLLHVMLALVADGMLRVEIHCAHVNHQLRGDEAQRDQDFVIDQCRKLKVAVTAERIDVRGYARAEKLSIETAARKLRIDCLLEIAARQNCVCIATAHQKNDNAETILHRLIRGTGFRGLCGIWPAKEFTGGVRFVRPLLCVNRSEIIQYLDSRNLKWCTDRTNEDCTYKRNLIRHRLLPALQKDCDGCLVDKLFELTKASRGFYRLICRSADAIWPDVATAEKQTVTLSLGKLADHQPDVKIEIVRRALAHLAAGEREITERHYGNILRLSESKTIQLPYDIEVHRQDTKIVFVHGQRKPAETSTTEPVVLKVPGLTEFADMRINAETFEYDAAKFEKFRATKSNSIEWFDLDGIEPPVTVRFRKRGDRFWPLGMQAEKKIGKFLTGEKIPQKYRQKLLVIEDAEKTIWLCPVRISEQTKITGRTKKVLQLQVCSRPA